jgi:hypothetical protein
MGSIEHPQRTRHSCRPPSESAEQTTNVPVSTLTSAGPA